MFHTQNILENEYKHVDAEDFHLTWVMKMEWLRKEMTDNQAQAKEEHKRLLDIV